MNALSAQPDFVVFTGDLTHTTDDAVKRRDRMKQFRDIAGKLRRPRPSASCRASTTPRSTAATPTRSSSATTHYTFDHKGVHFVVLDNVSDPGAVVGEAQLAWLAADLAKRKADAPIAVLTHRPLFDLYPEWDWATKDGAAALEILEPLPARDRLLRAHPPGAPPQDWPHRAPLGDVADVPAARARLGPEEGAGPVGRRSSRTAASAWRDVEAYPAKGSFRLEEKPIKAAEVRAPVAKEG